QIAKEVGIERADAAVLRRAIAAQQRLSDAEDQRRQRQQPEGQQGSGEKQLQAGIEGGGVRLAGTASHAVSRGRCGETGWHLGCWSVTSQLPARWMQRLLPSSASARWRSVIMHR